MKAVKNDSLFVVESADRALRRVSFSRYHVWLCGTDSKVQRLLRVLVINWCILFTVMSATNRQSAVGTATYVVTALWRHQAICNCGWHGKKRLVRGFAVTDALEHCARTRHGLH
jgi:hypothetical protein